KSQKQGFVARVEIGRPQLRVTFEIKPAGLHKAKRLEDASRHLSVASLWRAVLYDPEHPLAHACEIGVATLREGTQQIQRCGRLPIGLDLPARIRPSGLLGEGVVVDDIAAIARQLLAIAFLRRR